MRRYTSHCILNHTITTYSAKREERWWGDHEHPDVKIVRYDDNGNVLTVVRDGKNVRWIEHVEPSR